MQRKNDWVFTNGKRFDAVFELVNLDYSLLRW